MCRQGMCKEEKRSEKASTLLPRTDNSKESPFRGTEQWFSKRVGLRIAQRKYCKNGLLASPTVSNSLGVALEFVFPSSTSLGPHFENHVLGGEFY